LERLWRSQRTVPTVLVGGNKGEEAVTADDVTRDLSCGGGGAAGEQAGETADADAQAVRDILLTLRARTSHDFRHYKRPTVMRRIQRRMHIHALTSIAAYRDMVDKDHNEAQALLQDMLIGVTGFFRDAKAFAMLEQMVIPRLFERKDESEQ